MGIHIVTKRAYQYVLARVSILICMSSVTTFQITVILTPCLTHVLRIKRMQKRYETSLCPKCMNQPSSSSVTSCGHIRISSNQTCLPKTTIENCNEHADHITANSLLDPYALASDARASAPDAKNFKIGSINVCGLKNRCKYPDFVELIETFDILCIEETKLDEYDVINVPNYTFHSKPRKAKYKRKSGGIGFFVRNTISSNIELLESSSEYVFWLKLKLASECISEKDLVIGAIYIPPLQSRFYQEDEFYSLENDIQAKCNQFKYVMILGDVNGHTATSPDYIDFDDFQARLF